VATKLSVYNNILMHVGERKLSSLTENRKPRRLLDQLWDSDFVKECLEDGLWNFATRTVESEYNPSIDPDFGFAYAHDKPDDWVRTSALSLNDYFIDPLNAYNDEQSYLFCDAETIYFRYISDDDEYGGDLTIWPQSFTHFVELKGAARICKSLTQSDTETERLEKKAEKALRSAKNKDAMNDSVKFAPMGSWARARRGSRRGSPNNIRTI
jgi:hypothetical protein